MSAVLAPSDRPVAPTPNFAAIPVELAQLAQWVLWRYQLSKKGKWTKVPTRASGDNASTTDPATWTTIANAQRVYVTKPGQFDGVGFVTSSIDNTVLIDLDHVLDPETGEVAPWAQRILETAEREGAYVEQSPSGTGFHVIGHGEQFDDGTKRNDAELYCHGRFFTITGIGVTRDPQAPLGQLAETVALVRERICGNSSDKPPKAASVRIGQMDLAGKTADFVERIPQGSDDALLALARKAKNGAKFTRLFDQGDTSEYQSASEADLALASMLAFWCGTDAVAVERLMRCSALVREKWNTRRGESNYLADTITTAISTTREVYSPRQSNRRRLDSHDVVRITEGVQLGDFHAYMPMHQYIFAPSGEMWPSSSVNSRLPPQTTDDGKVLRASEWLDAHQAVEQLTWYPGEPALIEGRLIANGGWITRPGCRCFNLYRPPQIATGNPGEAGPWIEHVYKVYPDDAEHILLWLAHRRQRPQQKINHALVLGGGQGIGKDTILEPVKYAVGPWNFADVAPGHLLGRFNGFVKSVVLRVSEARDLGDVDRYAFYDHMKVYTAAPPDVLRCDEKNVREYSVPNVLSVVITSNHKQDGIYLPADDRRHYVAWSELSRDAFTPDYWTRLYRWYDQGGHGHVAAFLDQLDLSGFDPKAPPPKTPAFFDIVDANRAPEDAELADVIDLLGNPSAITLDMLAEQARHTREEFHAWLTDRKNRRQVPHRLESAGYVPVRNDADKRDGQWKVSGRRMTVYAARHLSVSDRHRAVTSLIRRCSR